MVPYTGPAEARDQSGLFPSHRRAVEVLLFLALLVMVTGLVVLRSHSADIQFLAEQSAALQQAIAWNNGALLVGGLLALVGALIVGGVASRYLSALSVTEPPLSPTLILRWDYLAFVAFASALVATGVLYWHLQNKVYTHWDILLFFGAIVLTGWGISRIDSSPISSRFPLRFLDFAAAFGLAVVSAAVSAVDLTKWNFAWVGDEGSFFGAARDIVLGHAWNFFELRGVYGTHPVLDSLYQALGMRLFGPDVVGWRAGEILVLAMSTALIYLLGVALFGRLPAVTAAIVLGTNHYLLALSRIAYNNTHMLIYTILAVLMLALMWRSGRLVFLFGLGVALGFCLYTFMAALLIWPIMALLVVVVILGRFTWRAVLACAFALLGFCMVIIPMLLTTPPGEILQLAINNSRAQLPPGDSTRIAMTNLAQSFIIFWDNVGLYHHFVGGPLVDVISGTLLLIGLVIALFRIGKWPERTVLLWFAIGLVLLAISSYDAHPQFTRVLFVLPAAALLAGLGLYGLAAPLLLMRRTKDEAQRLEEASHSSFGQARGRLLALRPLALSRFRIAVTPLFVCTLLVVVPLLNLYQLLVDSPAHVGANMPTMILKALQEHPDKLIVQVTPQGTRAKDDALIMIREYPDLVLRYRAVDAADLAAGRTPRVTDKLPIYLVDPEDRGIIDQVTRILSGAYRQTVDTDTAGVYWVWLFQPASPNGSSGEGFAPPLPADLTLEAEAHVPGSGGKQSTLQSIAADSQGNFYVAGHGDGMISKFDPHGRLLLQWGNTSAQTVFSDLAAIVVGKGDTLYALDQAAGTILAFDPEGHLRGVPLQIQDLNGHNLSVTPEGDLLVTGPGGLLRVDSNGAIMSGIGQMGNCNIKFNAPVDAEISTLGDLFVRDTGGSRFLHVSSWFCQNQDKSFIDEWTISHAENGIAQIAVDGYNRLFATLPESSEVVAYDDHGTLLRRLSPPGPGELSGIFIDAHDNLYLTYLGTGQAGGMVRKYKLR